MIKGMARLVAAAACGVAALVAACSDSSEAPQTEVRPVRAIRVAEEALTDLPSLVGEIRPHYEGDLGFKIGGRILSRPASLGTVVRKGDLLSRLDDQDERNQLLAAQADLASSKATLAQAAAEERRQVSLHGAGWTTDARLDSARQARQTAEASVAAAEAKLRLAKDRTGYADLRAPEDGAVTALGAEAGQVVSAGQMVVRLARLDCMDAVFSVSEATVRLASPGMEVAVSLLDSPSTAVTGHVSEISPAADPVTRTYAVKVALPPMPSDMRMGMTVVGRAASGRRAVVVLPGTALFDREGQPAVWVVDPADQTVSLVKVSVARIDSGRVLVDSGLPSGATVVTAGVQSLRPGQKVRLLDSETAAR